MTGGSILTRITRTSKEIARAESRIEALYAERLALYREGVAAGETKAAMARAASCSPEAVVKALGRADAADAAKG